MTSPKGSTSENPSNRSTNSDISPTRSFLLGVLLSQLDEIGKQTNYPRAFQAMERILSILKSSSLLHHSNDRLCQGLVSANALERIASAIQEPFLRKQREREQQECEQQEKELEERHLNFIDRGLRCITLIIFKSTERTNYLINHVGLGGILKLMKHHQTNIHLQSIFLALFICIPRSIDPIFATISTKRVMPLIFNFCVEAMCFYQESPVIFQAGCRVIQGWRTCIRRPITDGVLFSRIVKCVGQGLKLHVYNEKCQKAGRQVLPLLVGRAMAKTMINDITSTMTRTDTSQIHPEEHQAQQQRQGSDQFRNRANNTIVKASKCAPAA